MKKLTKLIVGSLQGMALIFIGSTATLAASTTGMPWESPLQTIRTSLNGPVAYSVAVIAIIVTGIMSVFGNSEGIFHKVFQIAFVLSIIFGSTTLISALFPSASGLVF